MVTAYSMMLTIALQLSIDDPILVLLFLIIAILFIIIFFSWWFGISDEDLDEVKEADANQISGPAVSGEEMAVYAEAEEDALATRAALLAKEAHHAEELVEIDEDESESEPVAAETAVVEAVEPEPEPVPVVPDDFKKIEGIGPKIDELLKAGGIQTYTQLADSEVDTIAQILADAGSRYKLSNPASWPAQAKLAAAGDWDGLNEFQDELHGGRHVEID